MDETLIVGPEMLQAMTEKIRIVQQNLKAAQDRQKSYADQHRKPLESEEGDNVFLKVSPIKGVRRFNVKGKLSPRFVGPYEIIQKINPLLMTYIATRTTTRTRCVPYLSTPKVCA